MQKVVIIQVDEKWNVLCIFIQYFVEPTSLGLNFFRSSCCVFFVKKIRFSSELWPDLVFCDLHSHIFSVLQMTLGKQKMEIVMLLFTEHLKLYLLLKRVGFIWLELFLFYFILMVYCNNLPLKFLKHDFFALSVLAHVIIEPNCLYVLTCYPSR